MPQLKFTAEDARSLVENSNRERDDRMIEDILVRIEEAARHSRYSIDVDNLDISSNAEEILKENGYNVRRELTREGDAYVIIDWINPIRRANDIDENS